MSSHTAHIAHAIAHLRGMPSLGASGPRLPSNVKTRSIARGGLPAWKMRKVIAHVEANVSRRIPIQELARLVCLSVSHFCRAFKRTFGASPHDYIQGRRVEIAQGLMLTTPEPLSSIALRCGLCDQSHLTRVFHSIVGESPYAWRRTRRDSLNIE